MPWLPALITWIPEDLLQTPGRLALSRTPGASGRPRDADLDRFAAESVHAVLCLQEEHELSMLPVSETLEERRAAVEARGIRFVHEPIVDMDAPGVARMQRLVAGVLADLDASRNVLVHCWAGLGRAGTVAACTLVARGLTPQVAVASLRRVRPGAVQSVVQERLVRQFGEALGGRGSPAP